MQVSSEKVAAGQMAVTIEVDPQRVEGFMDRAYRRLVQRVNIPGFRKGKAPRSVVERHLGPEAFLQEAIDIMVPVVCDEAIKEQGIEAIDVSDVEVEQKEPVVIKARVAVKPTVDLGDYRSLRLEKTPVAMDEARIEESLEELRHRYAILEPTERPVQWWDSLRADLRGIADGRTVFNEEDMQIHLHENEVLLVPGLAERLIGLTKGQEAEFAITLPDDFPRGLAGKECRCRVAIREVKEEKLPDLDDAFAREVGEGFASLEALRQHLLQELEERTQAESDAAYREAAMDRVLATAELEYPDILVEREVDHLLQDQSASAGRGEMERYLRQIGKTAEQIRDELRPDAEARLRRSLALSKLAEEEKITVEPPEVTQDIERMAATAGAQADQMRRLFDTPNGRDAIQRSLLTRKTLERVALIASGDTTAAAGEIAPAAQTQRRRGKKATI